MKTHTALTTFLLFSALVTAFAQLPSSTKCYLAPTMLADSARALEDHNVKYDPSYRQIPYPNGDVPQNIGVCTDIIIRAFRKAFGWDLQKSICQYRKARKLPTNTNIDHRRVKNLMPYFDQVKELKNNTSAPYKKGNIIIWNLGNGQLHIGICVDDNVIIHNICCGQVVEPMYMQEKVIRNYSWNCPELKELSIKELYNKALE